MPLHDALQRVHDQHTFLEFARTLAADRAEAVLAEVAIRSSPYGPDAGGWENTSIESYLESAIAWAESTEFGATKAGKTICGSVSPYFFMQARSTSNARQHANNPSQPIAVKARLQFNWARSA
jgi:hypothetical protein